MKKLFDLIDAAFGSSAEKVKADRGLLRKKLGERLRKLAEMEAYSDGTEAQQRFYNEEKPKVVALKLELDKADAMAAAMISTDTPSAAQEAVYFQEVLLSIPDEDKQRLAEIQKAWLADSEASKQFYPGTYIRAFQAHQEKIKVGIIAGEGGHIYEGWDVRDFEEDHSQKLSAYKQAIQRHGAAAFQILRPHLESFIEELESYCELLESNERDRAERFLIKFKPSEVLRLGRKLQLVLRRRIAEFNPRSGNAPKTIAGFLFDL